MQYLEFFIKMRYDIEDFFKDILNGYIGLFVLFIVSFYVEISSYRFLYVDLSINTILYLFVISAISSFILWYIFRNIPKFNNEEIGIIIALTKPESEERIKVNKELRMVANSLQQLVKKENVSDKVKIKVFPDRLTPLTEKDAHALRDKYKASLIIWGKISYGNNKNKGQTNFIPILFSYKLGLTQENNIKFNKNLNIILNKQKWIISDGDNLIDRDYLVRNLESFSLYIIGFVYYGINIDKSYIFLKRSLAVFSRKYQESLDDDYKIAQINIIISLNNILVFKMQNLELWPTSKNISSEIKKAEDILVDLKELNINKQYFNLQAILYILKGEFDSGLESLNNISELEQKGDPAVSFNKAYILYLRELVPEATKYFSFSLKKNFKLLSNQSPTLARWYEDELSKNTSKLYLNFPLGIIYFDLMKDKVLAKGCLEKALQYVLIKSNEYNTKNEKRWNRYIEYQCTKRLKKIENFKK